MVKEDLPVDKGWAWAVCGAVFIITFLLCAMGQMLSVTLLDLVAKYDTTITTLSFLFMFQICSTSVFSILATNFFVPRFGIRHVCVASAIVSVIASMIFPFSPSVYLSIALFTVKGGCNGCLAIPAISILGYYFKKRRSIATSLAMCGICSGSIAFPPFVRHILAIYGLEGTYLICAALEGHLVLACLLIRPVTMYRLPPPPQKLPETPEQDLNTYEMKPSGSMELIDDKHDEDEQFLGKEIEDSLLGRSPDDHEHNNHLYQKKHGVAKDVTGHNAHYYKPRSISFNNDDDVTGRSPKESLLISDGNDNNYENHHEKSEKMREAYQNNKTVSVNSHDTLVNRRRLLKDGQRPSLWSLASNPSTLGVATEVMEIDKEPEKKSLPRKGTCWARINQIFDFTLFRQWSFVWILIAAIPCGTNQLLFLYLPTIGFFRGVTKDQGALLLTIMGSVDLCSRLAIGFLADKKLFRISSIIGISSVLLGIVCIFIELYVDFLSLVVMAVCLGLFVGIRMSLGTVMFIEIVGLEKMAKGFSIYAMVLTLSGALHNPFLSKMMETLGVASMMYYLSFSFILGGLMVGGLPLVMRVEKRFKHIETKDNNNTKALNA